MFSGAHNFTYINNMQLGALCMLLLSDNINHIFICRQLCTKSGSKKRTFPGQKLDQWLYKENAKNVGQAGNYVVHLLLNNVKKNLQIIEEGLHFQASKKGITIVSPVRSTFNALQNVGN